MPNEDTPGRGLDAFFRTTSSEPNSAPEQGQPSPTVRTTLTLTLEDAERLELLRLHLRRTQGRGLTYGDVVGVALACLAETQSIPTAVK
ncbi:MAG: hypothetical protein R6X16_12745 [Anaerolineae bacterium]